MRSRNVVDDYICVCEKFVIWMKYVRTNFERGIGNETLKGVKPAINVLYLYYRQGQYTITLLLSLEKV